MQLSSILSPKQKVGTLLSEQHCEKKQVQIVYPNHQETFEATFIQPVMPDLFKKPIKQLDPNTKIQDESECITNCTGLPESAMEIEKNPQPSPYQNSNNSSPDSRISCATILDNKKLVISVEKLDSNDILYYSSTPRMKKGTFVKKVMYHS